LGIGAIYFLDLPNEYWGWKNIESYDTDMSFKSSLEYLGSLSYSEYLKNEFDVNGWGLDKEKRDRINKYYRKLSNTIHGKYSTFETVSDKLFEYDQLAYSSNLRDVIYCENIIISLFKERFQSCFSSLVVHLPAIERYTYGY